MSQPLWGMPKVGTWKESSLSDIARRCCQKYGQANEFSISIDPSFGAALAGHGGSKPLHVRSPHARGEVVLREVAECADATLRTGRPNITLETRAGSGARTSRPIRASLLFYFRLDSQDRLIMGGRGTFRAALRGDFLPHLHQPAPGLLIDIGCMGRGIGLQGAIGAALADYVSTGRREALPLPLPPVRMKPLPFHGLHGAYLAAIIAWYRMGAGGSREAVVGDNRRNAFAAVRSQVERAPHFAQFHPLSLPL